MADLGNFLANMLLGGLTEGQRRRQSGEDLRKTFAEESIKAQLKQAYPDPLTALLLRQFFPQGTSAPAGGIPAPTPDGSTGTSPGTLGGFAPQGFTLKGFKFGAPAEEKGREEADKELAKEAAKAEANIPAAIRDLDTLNQQFDEAFPSTPQTANQPAVQRAIGFSTKIGVRFGFPKPTPQQTGLLSSMPLAGIGLVRLAGALGRVTNLELQGAEKALNQQGLTSHERFETARALTRQYIARIAPGDWERITKRNPDLPLILQKYGIDVPHTSFLRGALSPKAQSIRDRLLQR